MASNRPNQTRVARVLCSSTTLAGLLKTEDVRTNIHIKKIASFSHHNLLPNLVGEAWWYQISGVITSILMFMMAVFLIRSAVHIFPQENVKCCQADARRRLGNICERLENRERDSQPRSVFRSFRKVDADEQESRAFYHFLGLNNSLPLTEIKHFGLQAFRVRAEESYIFRLVNSKLVV